ncbi:MAG: class I SAM-dependent methyltransferase [Lautropia sp.]
MLEYVAEAVQRVEDDPAIDSAAAAYAALRPLGLDDVGLLLLGMPDPRYPKLSGLLPAMASDEVQRNWTGNCGVALLKQTTSFVRLVSYNYARLTGRSLDGAKILDYGCGYGRMARLMYCFTEPANFHGVDPWDQSIELCRRAGLDTNFAVSDYLPNHLPVGDVAFDLIYAFSVFSHLSQRATLASLDTLSRYIAPSGILAITIRPIEYWNHDPHTNRQQQRALMQTHRAEGFAFQPHNRAPIDGDITYGDTSMTLDWLARNCPAWELCATDHSIDDEYQRYVFLRRARS